MPARVKLIVAPHLLADWKQPVIGLGLRYNFLVKITACLVEFGPAQIASWERRCKISYNTGFFLLLTTPSVGGLQSRSLRTDSVSWYLPPWLSVETPRPVWG